MTRFYVRNTQTNEIISNLVVSDLRTMAKDGRLSPNDRIRKSGHTTWHLAQNIVGLEFLELDVTSVISLHETEVTPTGPPQSGTLESSYEQISDQVPDKGSAMFTVRWTDNRVDGPFNLDSIESLVADGVIQHDCTFQKEGSQTWNPIVSLGIQSISSEYFVTWDDGRTDGPFNLPRIQSLVVDGFISNSCTFKHSEGAQVIPYSAMNLLDMQADPSTPPLAEIVSDSTHQQVTTATKPYKEKKIKQKKQKKEREPWRAGWFRRFVVKTTASLVIIALVIGLGCWGIWTAMSVSQKEIARNKYESIKKSFEDDTSESVVNPQSEDQPLNQAGEGGSSNQGSPSSSVSQVGDDFIGQMINTSVDNTIYSLPEAGPIWLHEELKMPVIGGVTNIPMLNEFIVQPYSLSWRPTENEYPFPQLFKLTPKNNFFRKWAPHVGGTPELLYGLTGRALYRTKKFGKTTWFGIDEISDSNPKPSSVDIALMAIASELGLFGQGANPSAMISNWYEDVHRNYRSNSWNPTTYNQWCILSAYIEDRDISFGRPLRDALKLNSYNPIDPTAAEEEIYVIEELKTDGIAMLSSSKHNFAFLYFDRDQNGRVVEIGTWNEQGENQSPILRYEYKIDGSISSFSIPGGAAADTWVRWIPKYTKGRLDSISTEPQSLALGKRSWGFEELREQRIECSYRYDSNGRAIEINLLFAILAKSYKKDRSDVVPVMELTETQDLSLTLSLEYEEQNEYWSTAILSSITLLSQNDQAPIKKENGVVRFEQHLVDNAQQKGSDSN